MYPLWTPIWPPKKFFRGEIFQGATDVISLVVKVKVLVDKLNLEPVPEIERAHRTGRPTRHDGTPKPRTVVCKFASYKAKESILKAARRVKPEGIHVFEDLAEETMEKRRAQLPQLRQAKAQGKIAYFSLDRLIIKDRPNGSGTMVSYPLISG